MNTTTNATFLGHNLLALRRMGAAAVLLLLLGAGARAQSPGSLNTSFNPGTGANSRVLGIVRQSDGKLVIGGQFTTFNGVARGRVARLNYDGSLDTSFDPGSGPDSTVNAVAVGADGKVVAGGDFFGVNGVSRTRLARFYVDGSLDLTFAPVVNGTIQAVAVDPAGRVYLAGSFTLVNGVSRSRVARLNIDGTLDLTFAPGTGPNSSVLGLELLADGKVLLAGYFSSVNGVTRHRVARLNTDGTVDTTFVPGTLDNGYANFTSTGSDGKILVGGGLYVGLNSRLLRLNPNGSVDTTFNVGNNVINSDVTTAVSHANGTVIIAGYFTAVNGVSRNSVARLLANGTLDTAFNPGVGANNRITEIVLEPDGSFVAGGDFTTYQGVSRNRITRIHSLFINQAPVFTVTNSTILEDSVLASVTVTGIAAGPVGDGLTVVPQAVTNLTATSSNPALVPDPLVTYTPGATTATLAFTPLANATGTVTITVVAQDNSGTANLGNDRSTNTFTLTVAPVNDAPSFTLATSALSSVGAVGEQSVPAFAANILPGPANEAGQTVSFSVANNNNLLFSTQPAIGANGTLTFTPAVMANGVATVTVIAQDNGGTANGGVDTSAAQTFTLTVVSGNVPPSASYATNNVVVLEDAAAQTVGAFATFSAGPVNENTQTVSLVSVTAANPALFSSQPALAANGTLTFTPAANANGATLVTVVVADDGGTASGGADRATNTFTITVTPVNDAPGFALPAGPAVGGSGTLWSWGYNEYGSIGNGTTANQLQPVAVLTTGVLADKTVTSVSVGNAHGLALCSDGTVAAWGRNLYGNLGTGNNNGSSVPVQVIQTGVLAGKTVTQVAAGSSHSLALCSDGTLVAWGQGNNGTLGNGGTAHVNQPVLVDQTGVLAGKTVTRIAGGGNQSFALCSDGTLVAWGYNNLGQLGTGSTSADVLVPALVDQSGVLAGKTVTKLAAGANHSLALCADGTLVAWGFNGSGQLGIGNLTSSASPVLVDRSGVLAGKTVVEITVGQSHSAVLCADGTIASWGRGYDSQLGNGTSTGDATLPVLVDRSGVLAGKTVTELQGGAVNTYALCSDGSVVVWGEGWFGGLGNGSTTPSPVPVLVSTSGLPAGQKFVKLFSGMSVGYTPMAMVGAGGGGGGGGAHTLTVAEDSGAYTGSGFVTSILTGPADESGQVVSFVVTSDNNALFASQPAIAADGTLTFTPAPNATGTATVTVRAQDDGGTANGGVDTSAAQTFTIVVNSVNDAPVITFAASLVVVAEDSGATNIVGFATVTTGPANESSQTITNFTVTSDNPTLFSVAPALTGGALSFTPAAGANGSALVTVVAQDDGGTDNGGANQTTRTFTITVSDFNDPPVITFASNVVVLQDSGAASLATFASITTGPANESSQSITNLSVSNDNTALFSAQPALSGGTLTFTPALNAVGLATVTVIAQDDGGTANGGVDKATNTFTISVIGVNHAPTFALRPVNTQSSLLNNGSFETGSFTGWTATDTANSTPALAVRANAANLGFFNVVSSDGTYSATHGFSGATAGSISIAQDVTLPPGGGATLSFAYRAAWQTFGAAADRVFRFVVQPGGGGADLLSQTILTATPNSFVFQTASTPVTVDLSAFAGQSVRLVLVTDIAAGDVGNGSFQLDNVRLSATTPNFTVFENSGASSTLNFATNILAGPATESAQTVAFLVANNNNDLFSSQPAVAADGTLTFTPALNANGLATVTVRAQDNGGTDNGGTDTSVPHTFSITVLPVNSAPGVTVNTAELVVNEDRGAYSGAIATITTGPADESGQSITNMVISNNNNALFSVQPAVSAGGVLTFTPTANANGSAVVTLSVQDDGGTANGGVNLTTRTFTITVTPVNDAPSFALPLGPLLPAGQNWILQSGYPQSDTPTIGYSPDGSRLMAGQWGGHSYLSTDHGLTWVARNTDTTRAYQGGFAFSADGSRIYAAPRYAPMLTSADGGTTWTTLPLTPGNNGFWTGVACSSSGQVVIGGNGDFGYLYTSTDYGATWTAHLTDAVRGWGGVAASSDGSVLAAASYARASGSIPDRIYISTDSGATWTARGPTAFWTGVACSADGTKLVGTTDGGQIHTSTDGGLNWTARESVRSWGRPVSSADGNTLLTVASGFMYRSTDAGETWVQDTTRSNWRAVTMTADGARFAATLAGAGGQVYTSSAGHGPYALAVAEDSGAYTGGANLATSISPGPADESAQTVSFTVSKNNNLLFSSQPAIAADGTLTFTPAANAFGSATVTVTAVDSGSGTPPNVNTSAAQTFTITVTGINEAPTVALSSANVTRNEDSGAYSQSGFATVTSFGPNESGQALIGHVVTSDNTALFSVQPAINTSGTLTFTPVANSNGVATVTVVSQDNGGTANGGVDKTTNTFTITINSVNDAPSFAVNSGLLSGGTPAPTAVAAWGNNNDGETAVPAGLSGVSAIAAGVNHNLALKSDGTVVAWGANFLGQRIVPVGLSGVTAVAAGGNHSLALKSDGTVVAWGDNSYGQRTVPAGLSGVTAIAAGLNHSLALKSDGTVVAWGDNSYDQRTVPAGLSGVTAVAAGGSHSLALKSDGTVVAWGSNAEGQRTVPAGLSGVTAIAAGLNHSLAVKSDGTVVAWGRNVEGQSNVPGGLSGVTAVSGGLYHSLALRSDGTVVAWGSNAHGQGNVPVGLSGVTAIGAGGYHSVALFVSGTATPNTILTVTEDAGAQSVALFATNIVAGPADESAQVVDFQVANNNNALFSSQPAIAADGTLTFTPAANAIGSATVTVQLHDDGGTANGGVDTSAAQIFTITVTPVNDAPSITLAATTVTVPEDSSAYSGALATFTTGPADESGQSITSVTVTANSNPGLFSVAPAVSTSGVLTFTPAANVIGSATVTIRAQDNGGTANGGVDTSAAVSFTIAVTGVNDAPSFALPTGTASGGARAVGVG